MLMNFGDDADMSFARRLVSTLLQSIDGGSETALLTAPGSVLDAQEEGNLVFAAVPGGQFTASQLQQIRAAGPHPGQVLAGQSLSLWAG